VDARLHHLQGKTELVTSDTPTTSALLAEFYADKLAAVTSHQAHARLIGQYDANNTYQYVINREEVQLSWLAKAIGDEGGAVPETAAAIATSKDKAEPRTLFDEDRKDAQTFMDKWRPRVEAMENARHKAMLRVILGETREQQRFFEQALAGRTDLLGRRTHDAGPSHGKVLPARWIE
jgi:hypothetical protein